MSISSQVKKKVASLEEGAVITFQDFKSFSNIQAVALTLSRLAKKGALERLEKGKYYLPKKSKFGKLGPSESDIIKNLLKSDGRSYVSGGAAYNKLGLTSQIPNEVTIVGEKYNRRATVGRLKIKYVKAKAPIQKNNIPLLQLLDALKDVKRIPGMSVDEALIIIKRKIEDIDKNGIKKLISLSQYYRPFVQATLGAILQEMGIKEAQELKRNFSPLSTFHLKLSVNTLPFKRNWNLG